MATLVFAFEWSAANAYANLGILSIWGAYLGSVVILVAMLAATCRCVWKGSYQEGERRAGEPNKCVPIMIFDSPQPMRTPSTPLSDERSVPYFRKKGRARRGGKRRWKSHRRGYTRRHDPKLKHHCGYSGVLWATGVKVTKKSVQELRNKVADLVYDAVVTEQMFGGVLAKDYVAKEEQSLNAYLADVRGSQWASYIL